MAAEVLAITSYVPMCHACYWVGTDTQLRDQALAEARSHDAQQHQVSMR